MDKKKILITGSIVAVILSVAVIIYVASKPKEEPEFTIDGINLPTNKDILKDTTIENLDITNTSLIIRNGRSNFQATISNKTDKDIKINKLYVIFREEDKENKILALYDSLVSPGEDSYINITSEKDLTNTSRIEYVIE